MSDKEVIIYTDGACSGNPGPGGYGAVMLYQGHRRELSAGFRDTTNNRMEIMAAIASLEALKEKCSVTLYTDSQYLVNAMEKGWAKKWRANGWMRNKKEPALNPDLWERLLTLCQYHKVKFLWVRGHSGNPENERCDQLAVEASKQPDLPPDIRVRV
ncbi:ribonuclease HI [Desulforamulus ruminis]|uniref:Ribonuclease H n=1 Tax=Desulforamulus ruminis (strain ATCC 23193 / DSM 2154 / NCIMB 8452 / DL) TaxID=696281 RepID=F6DN03_DESRL|nr:ribonuclease HI [Desulforamulus ruminis]AEG59461.1 Ribonuclease H [Desulforamulus ruminis DSM 2154]